MSDKTPEVSVVVPISERHDDMKLLYHLYADELKKLGKDFEFVFIVDGNFTVAFKDLKELKNGGNPIRVIKYSRTFWLSGSGVHEIWMFCHWLKSRWHYRCSCQWAGVLH